MRISINISTEKEMVYSEDGKGTPVLINKEDSKRQPQSFNYNANGVNINGSIEPLVDLILEWIKSKK
jgi:hypothetical protein